MRELEVSRAEAGQKLFSFLRRRLMADTGELHRWIRTGQVRVNQGRVRAFAKLNPGDSVRVPPFARPREIALAQSPFPGLIHEDERILVLNKPRGLPAQGGTGQADSLTARLREHYAGAAFVPALIHRLDKGTTGLILAGKTYRAVELLSELAAGRRPGFGKEYLAWVKGAWPGAGIVWLEDRLGRDEAAHRTRSLERKNTGLAPQDPRLARLLEEGRAEGGLAARPGLPVKQLEREGQSCSLLLIRLLGGRKHQIRVQLAARGFPVLGDGKYGGGKPDCGLLLHACRISLPAPFNLRIELAPDWPRPWAVPDLPLPINSLCELPAAAAGAKNEV